MIKVGSLIGIALVVFWLWAIFDALTTDQRYVRYLPKVAWVVLIILFFPIGSFFWAFLGKPRATTPARRGRTDDGGAPGFGLPRGGGPGFGPGAFGGRTNPGRPKSDRPVGPDDDPDFLKGL